ncbi:hypothetical protein ACWC10_00380 [Streptomyces sp. NPDC001595]|uniref:hypothetical protein n=1 Tax=Streptomyces sp. NPDC001532 TaxID=3154520 RepID=UPI003322A195
MNPDLAAALATVPEIARTERLLDEAKQRLREHPQGAVPDVARNEVIDAAVTAFQADGSWPSDIGRRASKAHTTALEWEAERLARQRAKESTELLAYDTRQALASDALEHLRTRLDEVLSDARKAAEVLGDVRSADDAIKAGGAVVEAWGRLQGLVDDLTNIRAAQWSLLTPAPRPRSIAGDHDDEQRRNLRQWKREGYGEVQGIRPADAPAFALDAMRTQRYTEAYLLWLAATGKAYVPTSYGDLEADVAASKEPVAYDDHGPVIDLSPRVLPLRKPRPAHTYTHSSTPHLDHSQPKPAKPEANAAHSDREPSTTDYF